MKHFVDGDCLVIVKDDFVNLQESPAVFYPICSDVACTVLDDSVLVLPVGELQRVWGMLNMQAKGE